MSVSKKTLINYLNNFTVFELRILNKYMGQNVTKQSGGYYNKKQMIYNLVGGSFRPPLEKKNKQAARVAAVRRDAGKKSRLLAASTTNGTQNRRGARRPGGQQQKGPVHPDTTALGLVSAGPPTAPEANTVSSGPPPVREGKVVKGDPLKWARNREYNAAARLQAAHRRRLQRKKMDQLWATKHLGSEEEELERLGNIRKAMDQVGNMLDEGLDRGRGANTDASLLRGMWVDNEGELVTKIDESANEDSQPPTQHVQDNKGIFGQRAAPPSVSLSEAAAAAAALGEQLQQMKPPTAAESTRDTMQRGATDKLLSKWENGFFEQGSSPAAHEPSAAAAAKAAKAAYFQLRRETGERLAAARAAAKAPAAKQTTALRQPPRTSTSSPKSAQPSSPKAPPTPSSKSCCWAVPT
jgi:hypothetical protein